MAFRTTNIVVSFTDRDAAATPMSTDFNVSTAGYRSPDSPFRYAPPRLKNSVTVDKSIGTLFWGEGSSIEIGNIDIAIEDGGTNLINGGQVDWVQFVIDNTNPQVVVSVVLSDGTLEVVVIADAEDVFFADNNTIRVVVEAKHGKELDSYINKFYPDTEERGIVGQPIPLQWGACLLAAGGPLVDTGSKPLFAVLKDSTVNRYDVTDEDLAIASPMPYLGMDRGIGLVEGDSPGINVVDNGFTLTSNPDGKITLQWWSDEGGGVMDPLETDTLLQGMYRICRLCCDRAGVDIASFFPDEADFPDLMLGTTGEEFPLVSWMSPITLRQALDELMSWVGGWWYVDELGNFVFGQLQGPENFVPVAEYTDNDQIGDISAVIDRAPGLSSKVKSNWRPAFYEEGEAAPGVPPAARDRMSKEWTISETTEAIPLVYQGASSTEPMPISTARTWFVSAYVQDELDRRWSDLYNGTRRFYTYAIPLRGDETLPDLGEVVSIQSDRFRLIADPLNVAVRRIKYDFGRGLMTQVGWGGNPDPLGWLIGTDGASDYGYEA